MQQCRRKTVPFSYRVWSMLTVGSRGYMNVTLWLYWMSSLFSGRTKETRTRDGGIRIVRKWGKHINSLCHIYVDFPARTLYFNVLMMIDKIYLIFKLYTVLLICYRLWLYTYDKSCVLAHNIQLCYSVFLSSHLYHLFASLLAWCSWCSWQWAIMIMSQLLNEHLRV